MALKFWTYLETDKYNIGLTTRTVYIYDKQGNEIIRFKDLIHAYMGCVSNNQDLLVVKSAMGKIAIYSLEKLKLIKKFRFSEVDGAQADNFIFTKDDKYFLNIERHNSSNETRLSIYDTSDFSLKKQLFGENDNLVLTTIEYDKESDDYFIMGFFRDLQTRVAKRFFIAKLIDDELKDMKFIESTEHHFLCLAKMVEFAGFTEESYYWLFVFKTISLSDLKSMNLSLSSLWKEKN